MRFSWNWLTKRKLRIDILTIFAILMVTISLTIVSYSYVKSSAVILDLGADLVEQSTQKVIDKFDEYIRPMSFVDASKVLLSDEKLDQDDDARLISFMHILLKTHPQLAGAYIADMHNNMFSESRFYNLDDKRYATEFTLNSEVPVGTKFISEVIEPKDGKFYLTRFFKDEMGKVISQKEGVQLDYQPTLQPWFRGALTNKNNSSWVEMNTPDDIPGPQMTVSQLITLNRKVVGVLGVDVSIDVIRNYLEEYKVSKNSVAFIVDHTGKVLTSLSQSEQQSAILPSIESLQDERLKMAYDLFKSTNQHHFTFVLNHVEYMAIFVPYALIGNNIWEIATVVPADDFIGESKAQHQDILLFSLMMLLVGLMLVLLFSYRISKPIMRLAKDAQNINKLDFSGTAIIKSHIYEIQVLSESFNAAKIALSSFAKYIPKTLVEKLMHAGTIAQVGGERREISVLFSDIRNFTTIAEKIPPEVLMLHVSDYLNAVTAIIHQYQGSVDKFIGDAVMAFWGAPLDDKNHVQHACLAALSCRNKINVLNEQWAKEGKPVLYTRFGLNTGVAVVGNLGSFDRLNYTALGDEVNLAARLEQVNKTYGTQVMVSEAIYRASHEQFLFRPVDIVKVKGKTSSTVVYELIAAKVGPTELLATPGQIELCQLTFEAYQAYQDGHIESAVAMFNAILMRFPGDPVAMCYLKRSQPA